MSAQFPYPNITGQTPQEQLRELKTYLYRLADQLNYTLNQLERGKEHET